VANKKQVETLIQRIEQWNNWRKQYPNEIIDLSFANLSRANLSFANLARVNLTEANLIGARLSEADFGEANLIEADLSFASLIGTCLIKADLNEANLSEADLSGACLSEANLSRVRLNGATLTGATLTGANLSRTDLGIANLSFANLNFANLSEASLIKANLTGANLTRANLRQVNLSEADLSGADLSGADLSRADLSRADLSGADLIKANLTGANLSEAHLVKTDLTGAILTDCTIYGIAAWNVHLEGAMQKNLTITQKSEASITIDNLKVAQFIYLMLDNQEIRDVINTLTTKSVLILGRFTSERKVILDALRDALRIHNYLPILFDFEKPTSLNLTETITTLAHLSHFIIVDLTDPRSVPHEAARIIPDCQTPIQPIIEGTKKPYSMFKDFYMLPWVLTPYCYKDKETLLSSLKEHVIEPAEHKAEELEKLKNGA
jgi:uncharacterized protein YjbI with pentapeptide repeats